MGPLADPAPVRKPRRFLHAGCEVVAHWPAGPPTRPPVLLIPGSFHGAWAYAFWAPALAASGFPAYAISLPNHGEAPCLPVEDFCRLTIGDMAERAGAVLDLAEAECATGPGFVLGHSLGGGIAQLVAQARALAGLVLVASVGPAALGLPPTRGILPTDAPMTITPEDAAARWFHDVEPDVLAWALARLSIESPGVANGSGGRTAVERARITAPALVVSAGRDATGVPDGALLAAHYGAAHLHFAASGHDLMLERRAQDAAGAIIAWLIGLAKATPG